MLFTSPIFLCAFLPLFLGAYYLAPRTTRARNAVALGGSIAFFAWGEPKFVPVLLLGVLIDYAISLQIAPGVPHADRSKRLLLALGISLNVIALVISKYLDFLVESIVDPLQPLTGFVIAPLHYPLLLGISFITFHRISYLVDSYKGRAIPPRGFLDCALYIFLFPQLIAGPIIRYHDIGAQIHEREHTAEGFLTGFARFSVGLAKKTWLADPLGLVTERVFGLSAMQLTAPYAWTGIAAYSLQIYFDFSGYSDMAIGLGKMMGFRFPENFNRPYISRSVTEFWRRWHISLSNWMRIYLYIPLGGNQASRARTYVNLWIVFLISGFWHGASWNFIAWGAYYGLFLSLERAAVESRPELSAAVPDGIKHAATLLIVMVGWVFFRSATLPAAGHYLAAMFGLGAAVPLDVAPWGLIVGNRDIAALAIGSILACAPVPRLAARLGERIAAPWSASMTVDGAAGVSAAFLASLALTLMSLAAIVSSDYTPFLYFRF